MNSGNTVLPSDRLALFGYGLFETLLVTEAGPFLAHLHWQRMNQGCRVLGLHMPPQQEWLTKIREFMLSLSPSETPPYALRLTLSGGNPQVNQPSRLLLQKRPIPYTSTQYSRGIRLHLLSYPRNEQSPLCSLKSTNYLENILAKEEAGRHSCDEGVWLNTRGYLMEGTMSNLFFVKDKTLFTPALSSGCLPGTRRLILLQSAAAQKIPSQEGLYTLNDLLSADEIFMTNSLMGIMPVCQVGHAAFPVSPPDSQDSVMRNLETQYHQLMSSDKITV